MTVVPGVPEALIFGDKSTVNEPSVALVVKEVMSLTVGLTVEVAVIVTVSLMPFAAVIGIVTKAVIVVVAFGFKEPVEVGDRVVLQLLPPTVKLKVSATLPVFVTCNVYVIVLPARPDAL